MTRQLRIIAPVDKGDTEPLWLDAGASVDRRAFLERSTAAALAAVLLSGCRFGTIYSPNSAVSLQVTVAKFPALATVGGMARVDNGSGPPVAMVCTGAGTYAAFSLVCPHQGCTVDLSGDHFQCPCHGAEFSSAGTWIGGHQTRNLTVLTVTYDASTGVASIANADSGAGGGGDDGGRDD